MGRLQPRHQIQSYVQQMEHGPTSLHVIVCMMMLSIEALTFVSDKIRIFWTLCTVFSYSQPTHAQQTSLTSFQSVVHLPRMTLMNLEMCLVCLVSHGIRSQEHLHRVQPYLWYVI